MKTSPESVGVFSATLEKLLHQLNANKIPMHSLLVAVGDNVILDAYWSPFTADTLHRMNSVTKSFVALAIGSLIYEGKISLADKVISYFPEADSFNTDPHQAELTVENLLTMRTGYRTVGNGHWVRDKNYERIKNYFERPPVARRNEEFFYDSAGSYILGVIVERLTGVSFIDYLKDKFLCKIGFSKNASCIKTPEGYSWSDSGLLCTPRDLYITAKFINNGGIWDGVRYIDENFIRSAVSNIVSTGEYGKNHKSYGYGYQIWRAPHGGFMFLGMGMQVMMYIPDTDMYIVCTADTQPNPKLLECFFSLCNELLIERGIDTTAKNDSVAYESLLNYVQKLELTAVDAGQISNSAHRICSTLYITDENPMGIKSFSVNVKEKTGVLSYENEQGKKEIVFGIGHNEYSLFPEDGYFDMQIGVSPKGHRYPIAASAGWQGESLIINIQFIGRHLGGVLITLTSMGEDVILSMKKSTNCFLDRYDGTATGRKC